MSRKTFISYKYSEATALRDRIIRALGDDAQYYQGETIESPDLTSYKAETIKENLKEMIYDSSVTIVIISPNMIQSNWIDWEIEYSLKEIPIDGKTSHTNGIVGVIMKFNGSYDWLITEGKKADGCSYMSYKDNMLYDIIKKNRYNNITDKKYGCERCRTYDPINGSYISFVKEDIFLKGTSVYIESAFDKSQRLDDFNITKER